MGPHGVQARSHAGIRGLRIVHHYTNGAYQHTAMHLELPGGVSTVNVSPKAKAERIAHYLSVIAHLTGKADPALRASVLAEGDPGPAERFLSQLPHGRHAAEVRDARDEQRFVQARIEAERDHRPCALRAYLVED